MKILKILKIEEIEEIEEIEILLFGFFKSFLIFYFLFKNIIKLKMISIESDSKMRIQAEIFQIQLGLKKYEMNSKKMSQLCLLINLQSEISNKIRWLCDDLNQSFDDCVNASVGCSNFTNNVVRKIDYRLDKLTKLKNSIEVYRRKLAAKDLLNEDEYLAILDSILAVDNRDIRDYYMNELIRFIDKF